MLRRDFWWLFGTIAICLLISSSAFSQEWPQYAIGPSQNGIDRGPGDYLSWPKILLLWLLFLVWVKTTDWVSRDTLKSGLPYTVWNVVAFAPFLVALLFLGFTLPIYLGGFLLSLLALFVPLGVYIYKRNAELPPHERVLTGDHIRFMFANMMKPLGVKIDAEQKAAHEQGAQVELKPVGEDNQKNQADLILARQSMGFVPTKNLLADSVKRRAERIMMDFDKEAVTVRYQIDGVWHEADSQERETGDEMLAVLKRISAVDPEERRKKQGGKFFAGFNGTKYSGSLVSQGTKTGERAIVQLDSGGVDFDSLADLGMRDKMEEQLKEVLGADTGFVLFSAPPAGGLTTTMLIAEKSTDRYMRDLVALQDFNNVDPVAENIESYTFGDGVDVEKELERLIRREPNGLIMKDLVSANVVKMLCKEAADNKIVFGAVRAKEAVEALLRVLMLKAPAKEFAPVIQAVLNQRLTRRLCEECKEAYTPPPSLLKKLGIPAGRVEHFYRPPEAIDPKDEPCKACEGIGYRGRIAIFELLLINDKMREALIKQPKLDVLRAVAKKAGHRTLQDEGIVLVVRGLTSLPEVLRVLKK